MFAESYDRLVDLDRQIQGDLDNIETVYRQSPACQKLGAIPGLGPLTATAMVAALGAGKNFENGRQVAAWLGIVPRQESSGGKPRLMGISQRGDTYRCTLLIHGARARWSRSPPARTTPCAAGSTTGCSAATPISRRWPWPIKNARTIWVLLTRDEDYRAPVSQAA